jgi:hypothetical protein
MCENFAPDLPARKRWRFAYYLVLLAIFGLGLYLAIASGSFG